MKIFSNAQIAEYYDRTAIHYQRAWDLNNSLALHYGYWDQQVQSFSASLQRMNEVLSEFGEITKQDLVLDAGCGVGGSLIFMAKNIGCTARGITLSQAQVESATRNATVNGVTSLLHFEKADFTATPFADDTFDVIWTLESVVHAADKALFFKEAHRILKKGGRLVMGEYFKSEKPFRNWENKMLEKWLHAWAVPNLCTLREGIEIAQNAGFQKFEHKDVTPHIQPSAWRIFYGSFFMAFLSGLYRIYNPKVSYFADNHYKALFFQYPCLKRKLWQYYFFICVK